VAQEKEVSLELHLHTFVHTQKSEQSGEGVRYT
jgi:hypothetical protein